METTREKQLGKLRGLFEKKQTAKALALAAQLLQKPATTDDLEILALCKQQRQFEFVLHALRKRLVNSDNILQELELYADTVTRKLLDAPEAAAENLVWLAGYIARIFPNINSPADLVYNLALRMGYDVSSQRAHVSCLLHQFLAPLINKLLEANRYADALALEPFAYDVYVKQAESETAFAEFMALVAGAMGVAGARLRSNSPQPALLPDHASVNVAFIVHHASTVAHVNAMLGFFEGLKEAACPLTPIVFVFAGRNAAMTEHCQRLNVKVVYLDEEPTDLCKKVILLKTRLTAENCQTAVWLCLANWMCFSFAYRIAPVQIWWSMKYHAFTAPDIDGYLCRFPVDHNFYDGTWRGGFLAVQQLFDAHKTSSAMELRQQQAGKTILGTMGRAELLNTPRFLAAVIAILRHNPQTHYLWTGREENSDIVAAFANAKVLQQTQFIGWVDTKLYAQVIDIYLDVFSFGTGFTLVEAMAAQKPVVFLDEKRDFSVLNVLRGLLANAYIALAPEQLGLLNQLVALSPEHYIALANNLIRSPASRQECGSVMAAMAAIFENKKLSAQIYYQHISEIAANSGQDNNANPVQECL